MLDKYKYRLERKKWRELKRERSEHIESTNAGQESVWDYPRPPRLEAVSEKIRVDFDGFVIASSVRAYRVIETANPPCYYLPFEDVRMEYLTPEDLTSFCEWKGIAHYWSVKLGEKCSQNAAWSYPDPEKGFDCIRNHMAFFAGRVDACYLGKSLVQPQSGDYYGGWITPNLTGPFKGKPGSELW